MGTVRFDPPALYAALDAERRRRGSPRGRRRAGDGPLLRPPRRGLHRRVATMTAIARIDISHHRPALDPPAADAGFRRSRSAADETRTKVGFPGATRTTSCCTSPPLTARSRADGQA